MCGPAHGDMESPMVARRRGHAVGRGHVSLLTNIDAWHCKRAVGIVDLLLYSDTIFNIKNEAQQQPRTHLVCGLCVACGCAPVGALAAPAGQQTGHDRAGQQRKLGLTTVYNVSGYIQLYHILQL